MDRGARSAPGTRQQRGLAQNLTLLSPALSNLRDTIAAGLIVILLLARTERLFTTQQEREALESG